MLMMIKEKEWDNCPLSGISDMAKLKEKAIKLSDSKIEVIISEFMHLVNTSSDGNDINVYAEIVKDFERLSK